MDTRRVINLRDQWTGHLLIIPYQATWATEQFASLMILRICYLPDCPKGRMVLQLLAIGFKRRLIFTVGRSVTTGREDVVTWNEIHHKTEPGIGDHGFPDPSFLDRCLQELAAQGITERDLSVQESLYQELR